MEEINLENIGESPVCGIPDETQLATIGIPFSIDIVASDPDGRINGIEVVNLPLWATLNIITELPAADAVACVSGMPGSEDIGLHIMSIVVTDNDGNQVVSLLKIEVDTETCGDIHPEEKKCCSGPLKFKSLI